MNKKSNNDIRNRFSDLNFEDFKNLAKDEKLSIYEKIGFPDDYREGREHAIFQDIASKATKLKQKQIAVLDIGPGCSDLPKYIIRNANALSQFITLIDSSEMLELLPEGKNIKKIAGEYPDCQEKLNGSKFDVIICYSVLQYIFASKNIFAFLEQLISILHSGGQALLGDIPNFSKRRRFLNSVQGKLYHQKYMNTNSEPTIETYPQEIDGIDDTVVRGLIDRAHVMGCDAYYLPQNSELPMANRRDDLLIIKP